MSKNNLHIKNDNLANQAAEGTIWNSIASIIQRIGGIIFTIMLARFLLPTGFGLYNLVISIGAVFFIFAQSGIDTTLVKYFSEALKSKNSNNKRAYFQYIYKIKIVFLLIISFLLVLFAYPLSNYVFNKPQMFIPLLLVTSYLFLLSLNEFFTAFFFAVRNVKHKVSKEIIYQISRISILIVMFIVIYSNPTIIHTFLALIIASIITLIFLIHKIYIISPDLFTKVNKLSKENKKRILKFSIFVSLASISLVFLGNIDTIMLGRLVQQTEFIGFYTSAFVLVASISGLLAFGQVLLPFFVQVDSKNLERVFNRALRYSMILAIPTAFGLAILGNYFLILLYGYEYLDGALSLFFLSFILILSAYIGLSTELFSAKNRPKDYLPLLFFVILLDVVLNYFLINLFASYNPLLSITGAAIATLISLTVYTIGLVILVRKKLKIKTELISIIKPFFAATFMAIVLYFLKIQFADINLIKGGLLVSSGVIAYFSILLLVKGIKKEDYELTKTMISKIKQHFKK